MADMTDPAGGTATAAGKDVNAQLALGLMNELAENLVGWAMDHRAGLAANGLSHLAPDPGNVREEPRFKERRRKVDDHIHELTEVRALPGDALRRLVVGLLRANPGGFPRWIADDLVKALEDLGGGDVAPVLAPAKKAKRSTDAKLLQLEAVKMVEYLHELDNATKAEARERVAIALRVSPSAVKLWEAELEKSLSAHRVQSAVVRAGNLGRTDRASDFNGALQRAEARLNELAAAFAASVQPDKLRAVLPSR